MGATKVAAMGVTAELGAEGEAAGSATATVAVSRAGGGGGGGAPPAGGGGGGGGGGAVRLVARSRLHFQLIR